VVKYQIMTYIRLIEIANTQELEMVKIAFNRAGIRYRTLFEYTLQVANMYALGDGGAIVEVAENEVEVAKEILREMGIEIEFDPAEAKFGFVSWFDENTHALPVLGKLEVGYRLLATLGLFAVLVASVAMVYLHQFTREKLTDNRWCAHEILHDGKRLQPNTLSVFEIKGLNWCKEGIRFRELGDVSLPGFNSNIAYGTWEYKRRCIIVITDMDIFGDIYEGEYEVEERWNGTVQLISKRTVIKMVRG
jgi:hypothetical protein